MSLQGSKLADEIKRHVVSTDYMGFDLNGNEAAELLAQHIEAAGWRHVGPAWLDLPKKLQVEIDALTAQRDNARRIAVSFENELAQIKHNTSNEADGQ